MKKPYEKPEINIKEFEIENLCNVTTCSGGSCETYNIDYLDLW